MKFISSSILPASDRDAERERERASEREVTVACVNFSLPASAGNYKQ